MLNQQFLSKIKQLSENGLDPKYYSKADAILIFYSIDDPKSLENVDSWAKKVLDYCSIDAQLYIVENKNDLKENSDENLLITDAGKDKAQKLNAHFESVSAKTGDNVKKLFLKIANECLQFERLIYLQNEPINLEKPTGDKTSNC